MRAIGVSHTACEDEFRRNLRSHSWSVFSFFIILYISLSALAFFFFFYPPADGEKESFSLPHFRVFSYASCVDLTSVLKESYRGSIIFSGMIVCGFKPKYYWCTRRTFYLPLFKVDIKRVCGGRCSLTGDLGPRPIGGVYLKKKTFHPNCEIEDFVETHLCKRCVILRSRVLRVVSPHYMYIMWQTSLCDTYFDNFVLL